MATLPSLWKIDKAGASLTSFGEGYLSPLLQRQKLSGWARSAMRTLCVSFCFLVPPVARPSLGFSALRSSSQPRCDACPSRHATGLRADETTGTALRFKRGGANVLLIHTILTAARPTSSASPRQEPRGPVVQSSHFLDKTVKRAAFRHLSGASGIRRCVAAPETLPVLPPPPFSIQRK